MLRGTNECEGRGDADAEMRTETGRKSSVRDGGVKERVRACVMDIWTVVHV